MGISAVVSAVVESVASVTVADVLTGAAIGAVVSGVTGGNILQGAVMGGIGGGLSDIGGSLYNAATGTTTGAASLAGNGIDTNILSASNYTPVGGPGINLSAGATGAPGINLAQAGSQAATGLANGGVSNTAGLGKVAYGTPTTSAIGAIPTPSINSALNPLPSLSGGSNSTSALTMPKSLSGSGLPSSPNSVGSTFQNATDITSQTGNAAPNLGAAPASNPLQTSADSLTGSSNLPPVSGAPELSGSSTSGVNPQYDLSGTGGTGAGVQIPTSSTPLDKATSGISTGNASSGGFVDALKTQVKNNALPMAVQGLGLAMNKMPQLPSSIKQGGSVSNNAATLSAQGNSMIDAANKGTVTAGQQSAINKQLQDNISQIKQYYSQAGLSNSSMEQSAIANAQSQATAQIEAIIQQNLTQGANLLGASDTTTMALANAQLQNQTNYDNSVQQMMTNLANAMGKSSGSQPNATTAGA